MLDVKKIRQDFPMLDGNKIMQGHKLVYLDNASTTFKPKCVLDAIANYYQNETSNSHRGDYDLLLDADSVEGQRGLAVYDLRQHPAHHLHHVHPGHAVYAAAEA